MHNFWDLSENCPEIINVQANDVFIRILDFIYPPICSLAMENGKGAAPFVVTDIKASQTLPKFCLLSTICVKRTELENLLLKVLK